MHRSSPARSRSFHQTIAMRALTPRPTLPESLIACALTYSGDYDVAKSIGNNVACYDADATSAELHDAIVASLKRHLEMGAAVSDIQMCARALARTFTKWHGERRFAA